MGFSGGPMNTTITQDLYQEHQRTSSQKKHKNKSSTNLYSASSIHALANRNIPTNSPPLTPMTHVHYATPLCQVSGRAQAVKSAPNSSMREGLSWMSLTSAMESDLQLLLVLMLLVSLQRILHVPLLLLLVRHPYRCCCTCACT